MTPAGWSGRRVLVTGHTGFKGSWLCLQLERLGADVTGFSRDVPTSPAAFEQLGIADRTRTLWGDVADAAAVRDAVRAARAEVVLHLAAQPLVRQSYADPLETYRTNVLGTAAVLDAVRGDDHARAVVVVTTDKCYANRGWHWGYREDDALGGADPYSSSKAAAELVATAYRESFLRAQGVGLATARGGNVIGGGDWATDRLVPDLARGYLTGRPVSIRSAAATRPWQHVLDCLTGYLVLAEHLLEDPAGFSEAWNFGPDTAQERSVQDVVDRLCALWGDALQVRAEDDGGPREAARLQVDASKARARLGWRPRWDVDEAVRRTAEWYAEHGRAGDLRALSLRQVEEHLGGTG